MSADFIRRVIELDDLEIKRVNRREREVTAYAAVFSDPAEIMDKHGHYWEEINRSAFNRKISHGWADVGVHYNHGYDLTGKPNMVGAVPIATCQELSVDGRGLITRSRYNDGPVADAVLAAWDGGQIRGQSFAGRVYRSNDLGTKDGLPHIELAELGLREYGPTHSPAYAGAGLIAIRSQDELAELVRSIISTMDGTPMVDPLSSATPSGPGAEPNAQPYEDPDAKAHHSSRIARNRLRLKRRALIMTGEDDA